MNHGKTVFAQLMSMIPEYEFDKCVVRYKGNYRVRNFSCRDHFYVMCFAQLTQRDSLRDIENCLKAVSNKLYHCGIKHAVPRNTLAKANENRDWRIYADFAQVLVDIARPMYQNDNNFRIDIDNLVYAFDSSTISLCLKLCPWATFRKNKGGVKMHTLLDLKCNLPVFMRLTEASVHDVKILDDIYIEPGAIYVIDKGYLDFSRLYKLIHANRAFFLTRAKDNMQYTVESSNTVDIESGVISDEMISLTGYFSGKHFPEPFRMVTYEDYATDVVYRFITNNTMLDPLTISELYRERWQVELFFKWIKQHLKINSFYGTSQNAVFCQIWIALCMYLIIAIAKKRCKIDQSLYSFSQICGITPFEKVPLNELFSKPSTSVPVDDFPNLFSNNHF
ncbi:MAG: IS4 family transposase [Bacteroidales bacterium]